jgi:hypothetical protein
VATIDKRIENLYKFCLDFGVMGNFNGLLDTQKIPSSAFSVLSISQHQPNRKDVNVGTNASDLSEYRLIRFFQTMFRSVDSPLPSKRRKVLFKVSVYHKSEFVHVTSYRGFESIGEEVYRRCQALFGNRVIWEHQSGHNEWESTIQSNMDMLN